MMKSQKRGSLGRGLDALITTDYLHGEVDTQGSSSMNELPLDSIVPTPGQPRREFDETALQELANSIKALGVIQPITVFEPEDPTGKYQIISGERRFRASQLIGLETIPAYIRRAKDQEVVEMALVENIQREDLNAIEISLAFKKLLETYHLTQEQLSERVGKKRATISNYIRLLRLPAEIQVGVKDKKISMGHARSLLSLEDPELQLLFYEQILKEELSVRDIEDLVRKYQEGDPDTEEKIDPKKWRERKADRSRGEEYALLSHRFSQLFKTKVKMSVNNDGKGKITIPFKDAEELENIIALLDRL